MGLGGGEIQLNWDRPGMAEEKEAQAGGMWLCRPGGRVSSVARTARTLARSETVQGSMRGESLH